MSPSKTLRAAFLRFLHHWVIRENHNENQSFHLVAQQPLQKKPVSLFVQLTAHFQNWRTPSLELIPILLPSSKRTRAMPMVTTPSSLIVMLLQEIVFKKSMFPSNEHSTWHRAGMWTSPKLRYSTGMAPTRISPVPGKLQNSTLLYKIREN